VEVFVVVFLIILAVFIFFVSRSVARSTDKAWAEAAVELGLEFRPSRLMRRRVIQGRHFGYNVKVTTFTRGSGKSSSTYTRVRVRFPSNLGLGLRLTREGFFTPFATMLGAQDIQVGDSGFDENVLVKGSDPAAVRKFLNAARRMRIQRFLVDQGTGSVHDRGVEWHTRGVIRDRQRIVSRVRSMRRLAWFLMGERKGDEDLQRVLEVRGEGRPEEALILLRDTRERPVPESRPETPPQEVPAEEDVPRVLEEAGVEEQFLEGELLLLAGRPSEAREVFEQALEAAPEDPEIREWVEQPVEETAPPEVAPPEKETPPPSLDVDAVCGALFPPEASSFQIHRLFEERYKGRVVAWSGVLRSLESYSYDCVFGSDPGTRAVVEVFEVEGGLFGDSMVSAVVQLPPEALEALQENKGKTVDFEGCLEKVDGCMRNLYVSGGKCTGVREETV